MKITYYVEDGYISGSRPQNIKVDDQDLADCETDEEKIQVIEAAIEDHFSQNISWSWDRKLK
jgi:sorbitol-specific phosphotransferase system component IIBC